MLRCGERATSEVAGVPANIDDVERSGRVDNSAYSMELQRLHVREPIFKRPFDFFLSGAGLLLSFPLWIVIAVGIWLEDGGPLFFWQDRIGRFGRLFRTLKFRSMTEAPDSVEVQARQKDPRITWVGTMLRKTALDELPQLWNIFTGDMSFVGPRSQPEKERVKVGSVEKELYIRDIPGYELRQLVRPGLTGVAQIYAPRDVLHRNKFRYDAIYVKRIIQENKNGVIGDLRVLWLDLRLVGISIWNSLTARWEV